MCKETKEKQLTITEKQLSTFIGQPEAFLIWANGMMHEGKVGFESKELSGVIADCGRLKWKKAIQFLKKNGLSKITGKDRICVSTSAGSGYAFYGFKLGAKNE